MLRFTLTKCLHTVVKVGWIITNDPLYIRIRDAVKVQIDLAAESAITVEHDTEKITVEIKFKQQFLSYSVE
ncbi:MAG: XisH family protein [Nostoc desertorum CM1-VF14]|jgi:hypothetical protein|nr:XisH family protein [Nostoc desertorum CM1-VF14]